MKFKDLSGLMGQSEMSTTERCYILTYENEYSQVHGYMVNALKYNNKKDGHERPSNNTNQKARDGDRTRDPLLGKEVLHR